MMDTQKAVELANQLMAPKAETEEVKTEAKVETEPVTETKGDEPATAAETPAETKTEPEKAEEPKPVDAEPEKKTETAQPAETETKSERKHNFTHQEQVDYAFKREKAKRKAAEAKYLALQKEMDALKKKQVDKSDPDYVDFAVDMKVKEREASQLQDQIRESQSIEFEELNEARIRDCFPDKAEQDKFHAIVKKEGSKLLQRLDEDDKEQAVLAFMDDSPIAPILTRLLIAKPEYLDEVLSKRSPYGKYMAMQKLAENVEAARQQMAAQKPVVHNQDEPAPQPKPVLPVVGSVTKSDANKDTKKVFDPNQLLHQLNSKGGKYRKF